MYPKSPHRLPRSDSSYMEYAEFPDGQNANSMNRRRALLGIRNLFNPRFINPDIEIILLGNRLVNVRCPNII